MYPPWAAQHHLRRQQSGDGCRRRSAAVLRGLYAFVACGDGQTVKASPSNWTSPPRQSQMHPAELDRG